MRLCAVIVVIIGAVGCLTDRVLADHDGVIVIDDDVVAHAKEATAQKRGLPFRRDVPLEVMTSDELTEWLNRFYDKRKASLVVSDRFHHKMGLLPPTRDTASTWKGFVGGFAGGVYDSAREGDDGQRGTMLLISDYAWWSKVQLDLFGFITGVDHAYEMFLAHELTHALQDQHLRLDRMLGEAVDDDQRMVRKTILESEANVIGMAHFAGIDLTKAAPRTVFFLFLHYNNLLNGPVMAAASRKTPSFFAKQGFAQYELGLRFVDERLTAGAKNNAALAELSRAAVRLPGDDGAYPESTEQLLFHKKNDPPKRIAPLPVDDDSSENEQRFMGLRAIDTGVFGALALKHWFEGAMAFGADAAADGWGGDRYELLVDDASLNNSGDGATVMVWRLLGDSAKDTKELAHAMRERLSKAYGEDRLNVVTDTDDDFEAIIAAAPDEQRAIRTTRPERLVIAVRDDKLVVINGLHQDADVAAWRERLLSLTVAEQRTVTDSARRREAQRQLEETLHEALSTMPTPTPAPLHTRVLSAPRTVSVGAEGVFLVDDVTELPTELPPWFLRVPLRWGVRPWLELSGVTSLSLHTSSGPFFFGAGVDVLSVPLFEPLTGPWAARALVTVGAEAGDVGVDARHRSTRRRHQRSPHVAPWRRRAARLSRRSYCRA